MPSAKTTALLAKFAAIKFHVSDAESGRYCVASFGSSDDVDAMADVLGFDQYNEWEKMDNEGNMVLDDNGCPFKSVASIIRTLLEVFKSGIEDGLVTKKQIKGQVQVWPAGVNRSIFTRDQIKSIVDG